MSDFCGGPKPANPGIFAEFAPQVAKAAGQVWPRYRHHMDRGDVEQAMWVWLLQNREKAAQLQAPWLLRRLRTAGERYCRKEKAQRGGYDTTDEYFYSITKLRSIVGDAFDPQAVPPSETYRADELYSEWVTEVADVRSGLRKIPLGDYTVLREYAEGGRVDDDAGVRHALWVLQRKLGGSRPKE